VPLTKTRRMVPSFVPASAPTSPELVTPTPVSSNNLDKQELKSILATNGLPDLISDTVDGSGQEFRGSTLLAETRTAIVHHTNDRYRTPERLSRARKTCLYFLELRSYFATRPRRDIPRQIPCHLGGHEK